MRNRTPSISTLAWVLSLFLTGAASAITITELHYNPEGPAETLEFIELTNDSSTPEDISGYAFTDGIRYTFDPGTILPAHGIIVVCSDVARIEERYGIDNAVGNFVDRLENGGERITLVNQSGVVLQSFTYEDGGKWPTGADGTGHSLVLLSPHLDPGEPESWTWSPQLGGSPGRLNFPEAGQPSFIDRDIVPAGEVWNYAKGTAPYSDPPLAWTEPGFDDSGWARGRVSIGYGDGDDATELTDMQNNYLSVACRKTFQVPVELREGPGNVTLGIDYDDGFCAFINGTLFARAGCGEPGPPLPHDAIATEAHEHGPESFFTIPSDLLAEGDGVNVIAVAGHNFSLGSSDLTIHPRILHRRLEEIGTATRPAIAFNELARDPIGSSGWVELHNFGASRVDLSGYSLADDPEGGPGPDREPEFVFGPGTTIPSGGFLTVAESAGPFDFGAFKVRLYLFDPDGLVAAAATFDRLPLEDGTLEGFVEVRFPEGAERLTVSDLPTPGEPNEATVEECIVINEIFYNPPDERDGEFIELHNRCDGAVDVSAFRFTRGIGYTLPTPTVLPAGGYLVIAADPALIESRYGLAKVLGPYEGQLSNGGENVRLVDLLGNIVDEVRYFDGGAWPEWADGGGSSLELIDPLQDNDFASAWAASDEAGAVEWERLSFRVPSYRSAGQSELHLYLVERGNCLVDDISITRDGGANHIPNPGFETSTSGWLINGTHIRSRRVTHDAHSGSACLEIDASGKGDTIINRLEIETSPRLTSGSYDVSLWAKWQRGGSLLIAHGEYTNGSFRTPHSPSTNLSGNSMSAALRMTIPLALGSPGRENGATAALRRARGTANLGPVIGELRHRPPLPTPGVPVEITARVSDSEGVDSVSVRYRVGDAQGVFSSAELFDDGKHRDGRAGDGLYGGSIPGQARAARVVYYVEASDRLGETHRFPVDAPGDTLIFMPDDFTPDRLNTYSYYLDNARTQELASRHKHSNDLLEGGFTFNNSESYYQVGVRYRGSPWGRSNSNIRLRFPDDDRFHRGRREINLSSRAGSGLEAAAYFLVGRAASPSKPAPTADYLYNWTKYNGGSRAKRAMIQPVDSDYHRKWYGDSEGGVVLKAVGRLLFDDAGANWSWEGATYVDRGSDTENYRGYYRHSMRQAMDDWESFKQLCDVMDRSTGNAAFDERIDSILDVEAFLRVIAPNILFNGWDQYAVGNGHNGYMALDPVDGRWELLPFDMDNSFSGSSSVNIYGTRDPEVARLLARPAPRRRYAQILNDYADAYWSAAGARPFLEQLSRDAGVATGAVIDFLAGSAQNIKTSTGALVSAPFAITTNGGQDLVTDEPAVGLSGTAPVTMATITVTRNDGDPFPLDAVWISPTSWRVELDLPGAINDFEFLGYSEDFEPLGRTGIIVTSTNVALPPEVTAWFPGSGPAAGGTEVTFFGSRFTRVTEVYFAGTPAASHEIVSDSVLTAVTPVVPLPLPADGLVDIRLEVSGGSTAELGKAFEYIAGGFVRGDANDSGGVEIGDAVTILFHLFRSLVLVCPDAADFDDDGSIDSADAVSVLAYLYLDGPPPAVPFPFAGDDPSPGDLLGDCE